jgi:mono/diheme cytochrome c family protein
MREPVPGTVPQGWLRADSIYFYGSDSQGNYVTVSPAPITQKLLQRGQERYNIYCSPCHSRLGDGKGIVVQRGMIPPPTFHSDRIRQFPDGEIFDAISNGVRNMPSYGDQVQVSDRWAIVSYIRALQLSQNAPADAVPPEIRSGLK